MTMARSQVLTALAMANEARLERGRIRKNIRDGRVPLARVLAERPKALSTMRLTDLLQCLPRYGEYRALRACRRAGLSPWLTVGQLTDRQAAVLAGLGLDSSETQP